MQSSIVFAVTLALAATIVAPLPVVRDLLLAMAVRLLQCLVVVGLALAAAFLLLPNLDAAIGQQIDIVLRSIPLRMVASEPDRAVALGRLALMAAPAALLLEFVYMLRKHVRMMQSIRDEVAASCRQLESESVLATSNLGGVQNAVEHMRSILQGQTRRRGASRPLRDA